MTLKTLSKIKISPPDDQKKFRFRLDFHESTQPSSIELDLSEDQVMYLLKARQTLQAKHHIRISPNLRPRGKPSLTVVQPED